MANKYYISNNIQFVRGQGALADYPSGASQFKHVDAQKYISTHPGYQMITCKRNKYIITTPQMFVGENGVAEKDIQKAKVFASVNDAYSFLEGNENIDYIGKDKFVVDSNLKKMRKNVIIQNKQEEDKPKRILFSPSDRHQVYKKSNSCSLCGKVLDETRFSIDHTMPLSRGGSNDLDNLRPVCHECNRLKGNFTDEEMYSVISDISCNNLYSSPTSEMSKKYIRAMVRGMIKNYGDKYYSKSGDVLSVNLA